MNARRLGKTDIEITPIGLGAMQFAGSGMSARIYPPLAGQTIQAVVRAALDGGINWFDTAELYGNGESERALTTALRSLGREPGSVRIATKWFPLARTAATIGRSIDDRLAALQGFPIDLYQIHSPHGALSSRDNQVLAMAELCKANKISSVGVSNFSAAQMERASDLLETHGITLAANQIRISLLHRNIERDGVLEAARRRGITLIAYSPLQSGLLSGKLHEAPQRLRSMNRARRMFGGFSQRTVRRSALLVDELRAIANAHGVSVSQVALSWLISYYGETVVAIPGASRPQQAEEAAAAMELRLTEQEREQIDSLSKQCHR